MRVLTRGKSPPTELRVICPRCKATYAFAPAEAREAEQGDDQRTYGMKAINCPECGHEQVWTRSGWEAATRRR